MARPTKAELIDLFWRSVWTFVQATTAAVTAAGIGWVDVSLRESAIIGGLGAVASVLKNFAAQKLGTSQPTGPQGSGIPTVAEIIKTR